MKLVLAYFCLLILFFSCNKNNIGDCFKSTGSVSVERRYGANFTWIELNDKINVNVYQGNEIKVEVVAGKNIIKKVITKFENGVLKIDNFNSCNFVRGYKHKIEINVTVPVLYRAINNGVGDIVLENFIQDTLILRTESTGQIFVSGRINEIRTSAHGNGDITLNGTCNSLQVYMFGTNYLFAKNLQVKNYIFIETKSLGKAHVNADGTGLMQYHIASGGNIEYTGNVKDLNGKIEEKAKGKILKVD